MVAWWTLVPVVYLGMSLGLLAGMYSEVDRKPLELADVVVLLTVGPFVATWLCGARMIRSRRK